MKATKNKSQTQRLLAYLKKHKKGITTMEAFRELGICRLSQRILELEDTVSHSAWDASGTEIEARFYNITRHKERHGNSNVVRYKLAK